MEPVVQESPQTSSDGSGQKESPTASTVTEHDKPASKKAYYVMVTLFICAVILAVGHHLFYSYLDGRQLDQIFVSQAWITRSGNAFAFAFKTVLVAGLAIAYCQVLWYCVRRQAFRIGSLDSMFSVLTDPLGLLNIDLLRRTTILSILAALSWFLPLAAIFSPGALTGYIPV